MYVRSASSSLENGLDFYLVCTSPGTSCSCSQDCAAGWLQVKHECLMCKTSIEQIDRYSKDKQQIEESAFIPRIAKRHIEDDSAEVGPPHQMAAQSLDRQFFVDEFTKLLSAIGQKHATYLTLRDQLDCRVMTGIEKDLDEMQNTVLDAMQHLSNDELSHDALNMHGLLTNLASDLASLDMIWQEEEHEEDPYEEQNEMIEHFVYKMNKPKRKGGPKGSNKISRKQSKNVVQTNDSTSDD